MPTFNEDTRVKIPATIQFLRLGYEYQSMQDCDIDFRTKIFVDRFKPAMERINGRTFSLEEIKAVLLSISKVMNNNDLGKEFYNWLVNPKDKVRLIDFDDIRNNDFAIVDELPYAISEDTMRGSFRPDINILINGIPLCFLEVKHPDNSGGIKEEFNRMLNQRLVKDEFKKYFNLLQLVAFSNNMEYEESDDAEDVKAGSFYSTPNGTKTSFSFFREDDPAYISNYPYKNITEAEIKYVIRDCGYNAASLWASPEFQYNLKVETPCNRFVTSLFDPERLLFMLRYGIMFVDGRAPERHIMRYPQFFAIRKLIERFEMGGKNGIIWHTQGSGKTALAAYANRVIRDYYAKKRVVARFFFIVDRLDLLRQAKTEFKNRGFHVISCESKEELTEILNSPLPTEVSADAIGEICVANIQKLESEMATARNDYDAAIQRVFFIDEAHRSYKSTGVFFANLMTCDLDAHYVALTGTPLLSKKERSNRKFGDYIHKYFYDKSIADGYTLRIKKENITTVEKSRIKRNLEIEDARLNDKDVYESDVFVSSIASFIERDFDNFRFVNQDRTIGAMIVCRSNPQARKIHEWFEVNSTKFKTGLVITDTSDTKQGEINKNNQIDFRDSLVPDILVVNYMLTTGYDVKRLKKMYLLREPHAQTLLQTISRVNRPYKSPTGKTYRYGYICDFVDIEGEYTKTLAAYTKELEEEINQNGENEGSLSGLVIDGDTINERYQRYKAELDSLFTFENHESFRVWVDSQSKELLLRIRRLLNGIKECHTEFLLSRATDYAAQIDLRFIAQLLKTVQGRIDFINLQTQPVGMMDIISDKEIVEIIYEFIKARVYVLNLAQFHPADPAVERFTEAVKEVQQEIKKNKNKTDIKIRMLDELLQEIFLKLDITNIDELTQDLLSALEEARRINSENDRIAEQYGGEFAFLRSHQDALTSFELSDQTVEKFMTIVYARIRDVMKTDSIIVQGKNNFIASIKKDITKTLLKEGIYKEIRGCYDQLLSNLYTNVQLYRN